MLAEMPGETATVRRLQCRAMRRIAALGLCPALLTVFLGCSADPTTSPQTITVFAATSLRRPFTEMGERFATDHPGAVVEFSFAGSSDLVTQLTQGAPADVFASADRTTMDKAVKADLLAGDPVDFAANTLTIAVAPGNPKKVTSFEDLARPDVSVVLCAPQVPCGSAAQKVQQAAEVRVNAVSEESSVADVLNKVVTGQADAGLVYVTDVQNAGDTVIAVGFGEAAAAVNTYPIAVLKQSRHTVLAKEFVDLVTGEAGQKILRAAGFAKP